MLAGLLYCGAGIGIAGIRRALPWIISRTPEVSLARSELPWLAGAIGSGGVVGPLLLMIGLTRTDAATASLLLTLEAAVTALMAWFIFHENYDRRVALGMAYLIAGAAILSWSGAPTINNMLRGEHQAPRLRPLRRRRGKIPDCRRSFASRLHQGCGPW